MALIISVYIYFNLICLQETQQHAFFPQKHMHLDGRLLWCRICTEGFSSEYNLVNHMAKKHYESELPYRCEVCNFVTSIFYSLIDHFNNVSIVEVLHI